jgi:hypothetical protein
MVIGMELDGVEFQVVRGGTRPVWVYLSSMSLRLFGERWMILYHVGVVIRVSFDGDR